MAHRNDGVEHANEMLQIEGDHAMFGLKTHVFDDSKKYSEIKEYIEDPIILDIFMYPTIVIVDDGQIFCSIRNNELCKFAKINKIALDKGEKVIHTSAQLDIIMEITVISEKYDNTRRIWYVSHDYRESRRCVKISTKKSLNSTNQTDIYTRWVPSISNYCTLIDGVLTSGDNVLTNVHCINDNLIVAGEQNPDGTYNVYHLGRNPFQTKLQTEFICKILPIPTSVQPIKNARNIA